VVGGITPGCQVSPAKRWLDPAATELPGAGERGQQVEPRITAHQGFVPGRGGVFVAREPRRSLFFFRRSEAARVSVFRHSRTWPAKRPGAKRRPAFYYSRSGETRAGGARHQGTRDRFGAGSRGPGAPQLGPPEKRGQTRAAGASRRGMVGREARRAERLISGSDGSDGKGGNFSMAPAVGPPQPDPNMNPRPAVRPGEAGAQTHLHFRHQTANRKPRPGTFVTPAGGIREQNPAPLI